MTVRINRQVSDIARTAMLMLATAFTSTVISPLATSVVAQEYVPAYGQTTKRPSGVQNIDRIGRFLGAGWGDGYHACESSGFHPLANLPPRSNQARQYHASRKNTRRPVISQKASPSFYHHFDSVAESMDEASAAVPDVSYDAYEMAMPGIDQEMHWSEDKELNHVLPECEAPLEYQPAAPQPNTINQTKLAKPDAEKQGSVLEGDEPASPSDRRPGQHQTWPKKPSVDMDDVLPSLNRPGTSESTVTPEQSIDLNTYLRKRSSVYEASARLGVPQSRSFGQPYQQPTQQPTQRFAPRNQPTNRLNKIVRLGQPQARGSVQADRPVQSSIRSDAPDFGPPNERVAEQPRRLASLMILPAKNFRT